MVQSSPVSPTTPSTTVSTASLQTSATDEQPPPATSPSETVPRRDETEHAAPDQLVQPSPGQMEMGIDSGAVWKEWKSSKIQAPWLFFHLSVTTALGTTLLSLLRLSRLNSGFVEIGNPPDILASNPDLLRAVWDNGIFYTTIPTFLMAVYGSMWEGIVDAVAERQPFVELVHGASSAKTVLLDYRAGNKATSVWKALRLGHYLLALYMGTSLLLTFGAVPMTAFLFTSQTPDLQFPTPLIVTSEINHSLVFKDFPYGPPVRMPLNWAAASVTMGAPPLPWTSGNISFAKFSLLPSETTPLGNGALLLNITAYLATAGCVALEQGSDFAWTVIGDHVPGLDTVQIRMNGIDRNCSISSDLIFVLRGQDAFKEISATTTQIRSCFDDGSSSRILFFAAKYIGDRLDNHNFSNVSVITCRPTYWAVHGTLNTSITPADSLYSDAPRINNFTPAWHLARQIPGTEHMVFEAALLYPFYFEPGLKLRITNDFSRFIFDIADFFQPEYPLQPSLLANVTAGMLERSYAGLAATVLSQEILDPQPTVGVAVIKHTRLVVVEPVAYSILGCLTLVAILSAAIMLISVTQSSALFEEPAGILSVAGIAQRSAHLTADITELNAQRECAGRLKDAAKRLRRFKEAEWKYDEGERHIFDTRRAGDGLLTVRGGEGRTSGRGYGTFPWEGSINRG